MPANIHLQNSPCPISVSLLPLIKELVSRIQPRTLIGNTIKLVLNTDGLPVARKSSGYDFWPLLVKIYVRDVDTSCLPLIIAGGYNQPLDNEYAEETLDEVNLLIANGLTVDDFHYKVECYYISADLPAREKITNVTGMYILHYCLFPVGGGA